MTDISSITIAAGMFGTVTLGTLVFLLLQIVKGFAPSLAGRNAEIAVIVVSFIGAALALWAANVDWTSRDTPIALIVGALSTTVIARGVFAQLFKVSVRGVPPPADASVPVASVTTSAGATRGATIDVPESPSEITSEHPVVPSPKARRPRKEPR